MPRYHFHIVDGVEVYDSLGATFPTDEAARIHAEELATLSEKLRAKAIRVTSETGAGLIRVPIRRREHTQS